jgi:hypothetical protein
VYLLGIVSRSSALPDDLVCITHPQMNPQRVPTSLSVKGFLSQKKITN